ncbi:hypothetical protein [Peribacillus acanthi]|uniref:hypothetical protein n=1 Tax=Peribacillus acanthi TaxID=2171554 RepID=UPI000D3E0D87|nr:hypothetical protein [Peribacillus acanthi]
MLYIIGAIIILLAGLIIAGEEGLGCAFFLIVGFILWRVGLLGIILRVLMWAGRLIFNVVKWILARIVYYGYRIGEFLDDRVLDFILLPI